jgi:hypothetical protein
MATTQDSGHWKQPPSTEGDSFVTYHGHGFLWEKEGVALADAAAQAFGLCLRWRRNGEHLKAKKLKKILSICKSQVASKDAIQRQWFSASLLRVVLSAWAQETREYPNGEEELPAHTAARARTTGALIAAIVDCFALEEECPIEKWPIDEITRYSQFIEREIGRAHQTELHMRALNWVLRSLTLSQKSCIQVKGLWLEFGVSEGKTLRRIASHCEAAGEIVAGGVVYGFDSFEGLPEAWRPGFTAGHFERDRGQAPSFEDLAEHAARIVIVEGTARHNLRSLRTPSNPLPSLQGLFQDTLVGFLAAHHEPISLLHLDADLYSSTIYVLRLLLEQNRIQKGTVVSEVTRAAISSALPLPPPAVIPFSSALPLPLRCTRSCSTRS